MENQMEKKMENEMETGIIMGHIRVILGGGSTEPEARGRVWNPKGLVRGAGGLEYFRAF